MHLLPKKKNHMHLCAIFFEPLYIYHFRWHTPFNTHTQLRHVAKTLKEEMRGCDDVM